MENVVKATLIAHNPKFKCEIVDRAGLARFAPPVGTSTWRPIAHADLVGTLIEQLQPYGLRVAREQYAVGKEGLALFGALDLVNGAGHQDRGMALGLRHSNDKALAVNLVGGARVFVCDNLSLSGEKIVLHKHSRAMQLANLIREGLARFLKAYARFDADVIEAEKISITDDEAKVKLFDLRYQGILPVSIFDEAATNYFKAETLGYADSAARTAWGLHNACTRAVKALAPASQFRILTDLGRAFGFGAERKQLTA
jgi:hypothetical protein